MPDTSLTLRHAVLALAVVVVWGMNFVVIKLALAQLPPLLFATLRFCFAFAPAALFLKRPAVPWRDMAAYGLLIGAGQFGLLYVAMSGHISPGLASLVVQTQVFFTIGLSMAVTRERVQGFQWIALALAAVGVVVIGAHASGATTPLGVGLTLMAAACWAGGNIVARRAGRIDMLAFVVWSSLFSVPPLVVLSLVFEGWPAIAHGLASAGPATWAAVLYQSVGNTLFGYAAWAFLLARYPTATVAPLSLLVPVVGMGAAALILAEPLPAWKLIAAGLVLSGLAVNMLWPLARARLARAALIPPP